MNNEKLKKEYDKLVAEIESVQMFDGRNAGVDVYVCEKCGKQFYTRYKDKGVTPFTIRCRRESCNATMIHRDTISEEQANNDGLVVCNWVRPTFEQLLKLSKGAREHVLNGGLMLEEELEKNKSIVEERFGKVQELLDSLQGEDATFMFITHEGNRFVLSGDPVNIEAQLVFAMCRYPVIRDIIKTCAERFDELNQKYGSAIRNVIMDHLIEQNSGN